MTDMANGSASWLDAVKPYMQKAPLGAFFLGISSGFPYAMIGATLTTRLAQDGIDKKAVTAFTLAFLVYNLKWLWAWVVDGVRLPVIGRLGQRVSWLLLAGLLVMAAVINLALVDPASGLLQTGNGKSFNLGSLTGDLKSQGAKKVCDEVLKHGQSLL